jgi:hypothetical protein
MSQPQTYDETDKERLLIATYYRPWSFFAYRWGLKLGPFSIFLYRGFNGWRRLEWTWMCGYGHRIF